MFPRLYEKKKKKHQQNLQHCQHNFAHTISAQQIRLHHGNNISVTNALGKLIYTGEAIVTLECHSYASLVLRSLTHSSVT